MADTPPPAVARICPGCGADVAADAAACGVCGTGRPTSYLLLPPDRYAMGTLFIGGAMCVVAMGLIGVMPTTPGFAGGGLLLLLGLGLMGMSVRGLRRPTREWALSAPSAQAKITVNDDGVVQIAYGSRSTHGSVEADLGPLASVSDADLCAALSEVLRAPAAVKVALPVMMALCAAARGEVQVRVRQTHRWANRNENVVAVEDVVIEELTVVDQPDWLRDHAAMQDEHGDAPGKDTVLAWLRANPEWTAFFNVE